jgi:hypothetical protein
MLVGRRLGGDADRLSGGDEREPVIRKAFVCGSGLGA